MSDPSSADLDPSGRREIAQAVDELLATGSEVPLEWWSVSRQIGEHESAIAADLTGSVETECGLRPVEASRMWNALQLAAE